MRQVINPQLQFGEVDIGAIALDPKSRDDIPQLLRGLQHIYTTPALRARVFAILAEIVPAGVHGQADTSTGRPGMEQWKILVLGVLRLGLNADYDRIHELANEHKTIRQMLGHSGWADGEEDRYGLQTIKDNLRLFTPEILERINQEVVAAGHALVKKSPEAPLHVRADSFVVETDVHYPTDLNLLWDALRKLIEILAGLCAELGIAGWRQSAYQLRQLKTLYRQVQRLKHSTSQDPDKRAAKQEDVRAAHRAYLEAAEALLARVRETRVHLIVSAVPAPFLEEIDLYLGDAERQIDQIRRRVLLGQTIPHAEKLFSLFQRHTEWIVKGKAGVPVELGLRVAVVEDQHRFILTHQVMEKTTDDQVAVALIETGPGALPHHRQRQLRQGLPQPGQSERTCRPDPAGGAAQEGQALRGPARARGRPRISPPAPPALRRGIGHQCPGGPWPGSLSGSWPRRFQALRGPGRGGAQHPAPGRPAAPAGGGATAGALSPCGLSTTEGGR